MKSIDDVGCFFEHEYIVTDDYYRHCVAYIMGKTLLGEFYKSKLESLSELENESHLDPELLDDMREFVRFLELVIK